MKKLLLVLLAVALAAFLVVGCTTVTPVTPVTPVTGIDCPTTVKVSGEVLIAGKNYIQGGVSKTITVTFTVPTAPVSVYVGEDIEKAGGLVPDDADEVVMYTTDNKVYTGTYTFVDTGCEADYIYVETCGACAACKYPYTVDGDAPEIELEICGKLASCPGCALSFSSTIGGTCAPVEHCYDCSGLASWTIDLYDLFPDFEECGCIPCVKPIETGTGTACPVSWKSAYAETIEEDGAWAVVTLVDKVGNSTKFGYAIVFGDSCDIISITPMDPVEDCLDAAPDAVECSPCVN